MNPDERLECVRRFSDSMFSWAAGRGRAIIIVHDNPDPDCLASAMVLQHLFSLKTGQVPVIAFSGIIGRSENLVMARELEIAMTPFEIISMDDFKVVCMVDTQPGTGNNPLGPDARVDIVIDHHPLREGTKKCRWVDVRDDYGVTATILYEYLVAQKVSISTRIATAIFYAIKSDTQDLGREANRPDREAYLRLFPHTNKRQLFLITNPRQPMDYFRTIRCALDNARIYGKALTVSLQSASFPELVAEMADFMLRLDEVETVLCIGEYAGGIVLSVRTLRQDMNAGEMAKRLVAGYGLAGGHAMMAGGKIDEISSFPGKAAEVEQLLVDRFLSEVGCLGIEPRRIEK